MRVAALYDVHGNVPVLEAVPAEVELVDPVPRAELVAFFGSQRR